jgi:mRNA interferase MazF
VTVARGDIYFVDLGPTRGREQRGRRPVLVVSSDAVNHQPLVVTVVVGTGGKRVREDYPVNVRASAAATGLPEETVFLCFQLRSLEPGRLGDARAGVMPAAKMAEVDRALRLVLEL